MRKKAKILLVCILLILVSLSLMGCGLFQSDTMKLKRLLKDKYGENFVVKEHHYEGDMFALCYPKRDSTLLFVVRTDAAVTTIVYDYYLQTVVQRQLDEAYAPLVEQAFPGSYLSTYLSASDYEGQTADKVSLASMLQYQNSSLDDDEVVWTYITVNIFVDTSQMKEENIEAEYAFLTDEIGGRVTRGELPEAIVILYFGDASFVQECEDILLEMPWHYKSDIYKKVEDYPQLWIWFYKDGIPQLSKKQGELTYEKYIEKRTEALEILLQG